MVALAQSVVSNPVSAGLEFGATGSPSVSLGSGATANNLLTGYIYGTAVGETFTAPTGGWSTAIQFNGTHAIGGVAIHYKVAAGSETAYNPTMGSASGAMVVAEWAGCATSSPLDLTGSGERATNGTSLTVTTAGSAAQASELFIAVCGNGNAITGRSISGYTVDYGAQEGILGSQVSTTASGTVSAAFAWSNTGLCSGVVATFKGAASDADPTLVRPPFQQAVWRMHHTEFDRAVRQCRQRFVEEPAGPWLRQQSTWANGRSACEVSVRERLHRVGMTYGAVR